MHSAILLPGSVLPARLAYGDLIEALGPGASAFAKDLAVYETAESPTDYSLEVELDAVLRAAHEAGLQHFHLVGYSGGGAVALALATRHPDRLLSLALLEPAWMGNDERSDEELAVWRDFDRIVALPPERFMPEFVRAALAPGTTPPPPPPGTPPPWMAQRPAGIAALIEAFKAFDLDLDALRTFPHPVLWVLGDLSNPDFYGRMADRAAGIFGDFTVEVFEGRHHFDPPHRAEPQRIAELLTSMWSRAEAGVAT